MTTDKLPVIKRSAGRPPKYADDELPLFEQRIADYFAECQAAEKNATTYGLALALGISHQCLWRYTNDETDEEGLRRKGFSDALKAAKLRIRSQVEDLLLSGKATVGSIFWLKNNAGWKDQQEQVHNTGIQVVINGQAFSSVESGVESKAIDVSYAPAMITVSVPSAADCVSADVVDDGE